MEAKPERLQKILAAAGLASRRKAEELIAAGVVSVNGHIITEPGTKADPRIDEIRVDGKLLGGPERHVYLAIYKPKGHMTTVSDPEGRPTVMDLLKGVDERVFPVGRLDYMSEGLLLLTNDGDLMAQLTKAGSHVAKTYMVKVSGKPTDEAIEKLRNGIMLPPEPGLTGARGKKQPGVERRSFAVLTQPAVIQLAVDQENPWFEVTLTEGRNRQLRRMFEQIGHHIEKIKRVRYASLTLDLEPGEFRHLTPKEVNQLRKSLETPFKPRPIKVKRRDDRPERAPRVDTARFVKGRRGKPSADAPAPSATREPAERSTVRSAVHRTTIGTDAPRRPYTPREDRPERSPRGPEFAAGPRLDSAPGFAAKRPYVRKPAAGARPSGDIEERPKRAYTRKPSGAFDRKPPSFARKSGGDFSKRDGGYAAKRAPARREPDFDDAPAKAPAPKSVGGFGFSKFNKPKFVKPSKHRDLGSDKTAPVGERSLFGAPKSASPSRPYSKDRGPATDRGYAKKPGAFSGTRTGTGTGSRPYSKGPGKPPARGAGDYKPRPAGDYKGDYKPRSSGTDFKRGGEARPPSRAGGYGKSFSSDRPRTSPGGARGKSSSGASYGAKRPSTGYGAKRPGTGFSAKRPGSAPPRGARPSPPARRRPHEE